MITSQAREDKYGKPRSGFSRKYKGRTNACIQVLPFILCVKSRRDFHIYSRSIWRQQTLIEIALFAISIRGAIEKRLTLTLRKCLHWNSFRINVKEFVAKTNAIVEMTAGNTERGTV